MSAKKFRLTIIITVVLAVGTFLTIRWNGNLTRKETRAPSKSIPKLKNDLLQGMTLKVPGTEEGSYWELKVAQFTNTDKIGDMTSIVGDYYVGKIVNYHVSARFGKVYWDSATVMFRQKVEFNAKDGKRITAEQVTWDSRRRKVTAEKKVTLSTSNFSMTTEKLSADLALEKVTFSGETKFVYLGQAKR